mmetsp:Transcript_23786/g.26035  ORF Transcript_23786/g.26035 Transcript_23786/m.26035 type:complete len:165 (+) Transcript_23786:4158-4652(+)
MKFVEQLVIGILFVSSVIHCYNINIMAFRRLHHSYYATMIRASSCSHFPRSGYFHSIQPRQLSVFRPSLPLWNSVGDGLVGGDTIVSRCERKIADLLKPVKVKVTSSNDDPNGSHIQIYCVSSQFEGKSVVQRQKLIYKAIWEELNGPVHAVDSIVAKTPNEAQ